jgi:hypothetical protein
MIDRVEPRLTLTCVNIVGLKKFAFEKLAPQSVLRDVLLSEKDELNASEFLGKVGVWLRLLRLEFRPSSARPEPAEKVT